MILDKWVWLEKKESLPDLLELDHGTSSQELPRQKYEGIIEEK